MTGDPLAPQAAPPAFPSTEAQAGRPRSVRLAIEIAETILLTLVIFFVLHTFVAQPFQVQMRSMETTFIEGDYVLVDRLTPMWNAYAPGEVIVFRPPDAWSQRDDPFIKRVIAVGGDTISIDDDGAVRVNGEVLDEPYLFRNGNGDIEPTDVGGQSTWLVPEGQLFVMGDHRRSSSDSRIFGPVPVSSVIGRAVLRYWPIEKLGFVETPTYASLAR